MKTAKRTDRTTAAPGPELNFDMNDLTADAIRNREYRELLIALAEGREIDESNLSRIVGDRTPEQFDHDIKRVRGRYHAWQQLAGCAELEAQREAVLAKCVEITNSTQKLIEDANRSIAANHELFVQAKQQADSLGSRLSAQKRYARQELLRTAADDKKDLLHEIRSKINQLAEERTRLALKRSEMQQSQDAILQIENLTLRIAQAERERAKLPNGSPERGEASVSLVVLRNGLGMAQAIIAEFDNRLQKSAELQNEIYELEKQIRRLAGDPLDWKNFSV